MPAPSSALINATLYHVWVERNGERYHSLAIKVDGGLQRHQHCRGCPEYIPSTSRERARAAGWEWRGAKRFGDVACPACDAFLCEELRLGIWVETGTVRERCTPCLLDLLEIE